ncbi:MAG: hypothetical protein HC896_16955 [Bacteroidales bacterium]|nr:hypothetical protein [Bacteroidales bacterium]
MPNSNNLYHISNYGRVKSFVYDKNEGQLMKFSEIKGFKQVHMTIDKVRSRFYVHKLVAQIWIPQPSDEHIYVTHLDSNKTNNHVSNLEWHTKETLKAKHRELQKRKHNNSKRHRAVNSRLKEEDVILLKSMLQRGVVQAKIAKMFCISEMQVTRIKRGENWGHVQLK